MEGAFPIHYHNFTSILPTWLILLILRIQIKGRFNIHTIIYSPIYYKYYVKSLRD